MFRLRRKVYKHRERALGDISLKNQYKEFFKGLSIAMSQTYNEIETVRAQIVASQLFTLPGGSSLLKYTAYRQPLPAR
jgi:hypothetical protein